MHHTGCKYISVVFIVFGYELFTNHTLVSINVPDRNHVLFTLGKQNQGFGLAGRYATLCQLTNIIFSELEA
jgi:hypothetical protein